MREWVGAAAAAAAVVGLLAGPAAAEPVDLGAYAGPLRFEAPSGTTLSVEGVGRYLDTLELRLGPGGELILINELSIEDYVAGIAEMPASWPLEALKAQAVAARTYAWYQARLGTFAARGYDICPTVACQVFRGAEVVETPLVGWRWRTAVDATAGEVLTSGGAPILARYFSTSGGRTRANEEVFIREGPRPYLKAVDDPEDVVSPLHTWQVRFDRADFDAILARGQQLRTVVPVARIDVLPAAAGRPDRVRVVGASGRSVLLPASEFRRFVSEVAPELFPDRYPGRRRDGRPMPATLPSSRFTVTITATEVVFDGRGWGHGVGMSQWGARGKAERGMSYEDILAAYYGGLRPARAAGLPARIRVGLTSGRGPFTIRADGPFRVVAAGTTITDRGLGTWSGTLREDGTIGLSAPEGYGAPLVVSPTQTQRPQPTEVEVVVFEAVVNKAAELVLEVRGADGASLLTQPVGVVDAGRHTVAWDLDGDAGPLPPGTYEVVLRATDERGEVAGTPTEVRIRPLTLSRPASVLPPLTASPGEVPLWLAALAGGLVGASGRLILAARR